MLSESKGRIGGQNDCETVIAEFIRTRGSYSLPHCLRLADPGLS